MDADEDLALQLLARAGALLEDASATAILADGKRVSERITTVLNVLSSAKALVEAAAVIATTERLVERPSCPAT